MAMQLPPLLRRRILAEASSIGRGMADSDLMFYGGLGLAAGVSAKYFYNMVFPDVRFKLSPPEAQVMTDKMETVGHDASWWFKTLEARLTAMEAAVRSIEGAMSKNGSRLCWCLCVWAEFGAWLKFAGTKTLAPGGQASPHRRSNLRVRTPVFPKPVNTALASFQARAASPCFITTTSPSLHLKVPPEGVAVKMATEAQKAARNLSQGMNMRGITSQPPSIKYLAAGFLVGIGGKYVYDVYYPARPEPEVQGVKDKVTDVQAETIKRLQGMDSRMKTLQEKLGNIQGVLSRK